MPEPTQGHKDEKPSPQVSPGKPGDEPDDPQRGESDKLSRGNNDDEHRQSGD